MIQMHERGKIIRLEKRGKETVSSTVVPRAVTIKGISTCLLQRKTITPIHHSRLQEARALLKKPKKAL